MMIPVRCMTCGKPVAHLWEEYKTRTEKGEDPKKVLDEIGMKRYCCRSVFMSNVELIDDVARFKR